MFPSACFSLVIFYVVHLCVAFHYQHLGIRICNLKNGVCLPSNASTCNTLDAECDEGNICCEGQDCAWDKDVDFPENHPLILDSSFQMVLPVNEGDKRMVRVEAGAELTIACSGTIITELGLSDVQATCAGEKLIKLEDTEWTLAELGCTDDVSESIHKDQGNCGDQGIGINEIIGFEIETTGDFYELIRVCFDPAAETTIYSQHTVHGASIAAKDIDPGRPAFKTSRGFYTVSMSKVYAEKSQLELMVELLGDEDLAHKMIDPSKLFYFAKGHMAPDAAFVTATEQDATYYYINAVPQWQSFNNGNWRNLESATRELAESHGTDLTIYSGGWGVLELDDINGKPVEIYLGLYEDEKVVPVPALTWKVVYEEISNRAAAVVGINNPHITSGPPPLCEDICSSIKWLDFDFDILEHGYTYCCTVQDLRATIPHVPDLGDVELLDE